MTQQPHYAPYTHPGSYAPAPVRKPSIFGRIWRGTVKVFLYAFLAFHYTAYALSWVYILVPILGWRKQTRLGLAYIGLITFLIAAAIGIYSSMTGDRTAPETFSHI